MDIDIESYKHNAKSESMSPDVRKSTAPKINIDDVIQDERDSTKTREMTEEEKIAMAQKKVLERLKMAGITNIGEHMMNDDDYDESIEIKKSIRQNKRSNNNSSINTSNNNSDINSSNIDINDGGSNIISNQIENKNSDVNSLILNGYNKAINAALDQSNALDEEDFLENTNIYVGGLHQDIDTYQLRKYFEHCGDILNVKVDMKRKGFGFVTFGSHEQAKMAIEDMDGRYLHGQPIKCAW
eukprot:CAMPEP_0114659686 /NCGR_PEP_ID=MMETSP0191-20121206/18320_1 /TAXON_ID=126664 /ORGANISM="Sorites sp." /LENGTH=240 /DNA_ID=CAMNT_0001885605 /DNA_START=276 /DNA_END=995 /DNA_ORIENTATION=-